MNHLVLAQMAGPDGPSPFGPLLMMTAIFGIFYVLVIRPQQNREREKDDFRARLKKGDEVLAAGGILGRVADIKGAIVTVDLAPNIRVRVERRSIEPLRTAKSEKNEEKEATAS
jgi:preprotein translocase subunit YajC